jgi:Ca2+-binding EF-hand superfamily protein
MVKSGQNNDQKDEGKIKLMLTKLGLLRDQVNLTQEERFMLNKTFVLKYNYKIQDKLDSFLDECPDGSMNKKQLVKLYRSFYKRTDKDPKSAEKLAKFAFLYFDDDRDGRISISD